MNYTIFNLNYYLENYENAMYLYSELSNDIFNIFETNISVKEKYKKTIELFKAVSKEKRYSMTNAFIIELLYSDFNKSFDNQTRFSLGGKIVSRFIAKRVMKYSLMGCNVRNNQYINTSIEEIIKEFDEINNTNLLKAFADIIYAHFDDEYVLDVA